MSTRPFYLFNAYKTGQNIIRGCSASIPREPHQKLVTELFSPFIINTFAFFRTPQRPVFQDEQCFLRGSGSGSNKIEKCGSGSVVGSIVLDNFRPKGTHLSRVLNRKNLRGKFCKFVLIEESTSFHKASAITHFQDHAVQYIPVLFVSTCIHASSVICYIMHGELMLSTTNAFNP
jgi:hypothetical protein